MEKIEDTKNIENEEDKIIDTNNYGYIFLCFIASLLGKDIEAEINYFKEQTEKLTEENEVMEKQIDKLIKDKEDLEKINKKLISKKHAQKYEINEFSGIVAKFKEQNNELNQENVQLKKENEQLKQEKENMMEEINVLKKVIVDIKQENEILKSKNDNLNKIIEDYRKADKIDDIEIELDMENKETTLSEEYERNLEESNTLKLVLHDFDHFMELTNMLDDVVCENCRLIEEHNNLLKLKKDFEMIDGLETGIFQDHK